MAAEVGDGVGLVGGGTAAKMAGGASSSRVLCECSRAPSVRTNTASATIPSADTIIRFMILPQEYGLGVNRLTLTPTVAEYNG